MRSSLGLHRDLQAKSLQWQNLNFPRLTVWIQTACWALVQLWFKIFAATGNSICVACAVGQCANHYTNDSWLVKFQCHVEFQRTSGLNWHAESASWKFDIWILNYQDYFTKSIHLGPLVTMFCTEKLSIVVEDVIECTYSTNRDIECVHSIK